MSAAAIIREQRLNERMKGDPRLDVGDMTALHACLYAAAMMVKRGALPEDASDIKAHWKPELRTVTFWREGALVATYRIPDRVMDYDPSNAVIEVKDGRP